MLNNQEEQENQEQSALSETVSNLEAMIKQCAENNHCGESCVALVRCIPTADLESWQEVVKTQHYDDWFTMKIDLNAIDSSPIIDEAKKKIEEQQALLKIQNSKCLVEVHEKQFLFFGTL